MKSIVKLSLASLCAYGAIFAAQANNSQSAASNKDSDKQLVVTEPAGADNSTSQTSTTYQSTGTSYSSGNTIQSSSYPSSGYYQTSSTAGVSPGWVTGREQDAYANCILHRYQAGKGSARATDEHYWNNVNPDRLYAQYPAGGSMGYQNVASTSGSSSWTSSSSSSSWSGGSSMSGSGLWYGPDGKIYNSATSMTPINGSGSFQESAGSQSSATQSGTSGAQSSTELKSSSQDQGSLNKSSQNQAGSATSEAAGANTTTTSDQDKNSPSSSSDQSGKDQQNSSSTPSSPDQTSTSSSSSTPSTSDQSTQSSTSSSSANQGMSEKVRSSFQSDSTLQPLASNVTVQDQEGKVALNGTVKSEAEKQQIVSKAEEIAGSGNVVDNLQVKSDNSNP